jgi:hypothetical protein
MAADISGRQEAEQHEITQPKWTGRMDNVTRQSGVSIESELKAQMTSLPKCSIRNKTNQPKNHPSIQPTNLRTMSIPQAKEWIIVNNKLEDMLKKQVKFNFRYFPSI